MTPSSAATLAEARRLIGVGERDAAFALLRRAIHESPREAALWYALAQATAVREQRAEALRRCLTLDPTHSEARAALAAMVGAPPALPSARRAGQPAAPDGPPTLWPDRRKGAPPPPPERKAPPIGRTAPFPLETQPGAPFPPLAVPPPPSTQPVPRRWYGIAGVGVMLTLLLLCGGLGLRNASRVVPAPLARRVPAVATALMRTELLARPAPTALPEPSWVTQAVAAQRVNDFARAQTLLSEGLSQGSDEFSTRVALAQLYNDWPGQGANAGEAARMALESATTMAERALALEAYVVAEMAQPAPDVAALAALAGQITAAVPSSPHAPWASAAVAAMAGDEAACRAAAALALHLDRRSGGTPAALNGAILARLGDREGDQPVRSGARRDGLRAVARGAGAAAPRRGARGGGPAAPRCAARGDARSSAARGAVTRGESGEWRVRSAGIRSRREGARDEWSCVGDCGEEGGGVEAIVRIRTADREAVLVCQMELSVVHRERQPVADATALKDASQKSLLLEASAYADATACSASGRFSGLCSLSPAASCEAPFRVAPGSPAMHLPHLNWYKQ